MPDSTTPYVYPTTPERPRDGEPCGHPGCLSHVSHPCEMCGRIGGYPTYTGTSESLVTRLRAIIHQLNADRDADAATIRRLRREIDAQVARAEGCAPWDVAVLEASGRADGE